MDTTRPAAIDGGDSLDGPQLCLNPDPFRGDDYATPRPTPCPHCADLGYQCPDCRADIHFNFDNTNED